MSSNFEVHDSSSPIFRILLQNILRCNEAKLVNNRTNLEFFKVSVSGFCKCLGNEKWTTRDRFARNSLFIFHREIWKISISCGLLTLYAVRVVAQYLIASAFLFTILKCIREKNNDRWKNSFATTLINCNNGFIDWMVGFLAFVVYRSMQKHR